ncbi:hypothetical protein GCM10027601_21410 [Nocardioides ungokensis]
MSSEGYKPTMGAQNRGGKALTAATWVVLAALFVVIVVVPAMGGVGPETGNRIKFFGVAIALPIWFLALVRIFPKIDSANRAGLRSTEAVQRAQRFTFWAAVIVAEGTWILAWLALGAL